MTAASALIPGKLIVRPWVNHSKTTIGYIDGEGKFVALADCSIGPDFAANYEPLALVLAAAPELLVALKLMTGWDKPVGPGTPEWDSAIAAIAKAEGSAA